MLITLKDLTAHNIDEKRGQKLKQLFYADQLPSQINLDGRGLMVKLDDIMLIDGEVVAGTPSKVFSNSTDQSSGELTKAQAWKIAIHRNLDDLKQTGKYGTWTAAHIIDEHQTLQGGEGEVRQASVPDTPAQAQLL